MATTTAPTKGTSIFLQEATKTKFLAASKVYGISADRMVQALLRAWASLPESKRHQFTLDQS